MKQLLITFSVAIVGLMVLTFDAQLVQSKAVQAANATNATNASVVLVNQLAQNLSQAMQLIQNLTHQIAQLNATANATASNATKVQKAPAVANATVLTPLNASVSIQNFTQALQLLQNLTHQFEAITNFNQTNLNQTANATKVQKAPAVANATVLTPLNASASIQNFTQALQLLQNLTHNFEAISHFNQTNLNQTANATRVIRSAPSFNATILAPLNATSNSSSAANSSNIASQNVTQLYLLTLENSRNIAALSKNISNLSNLFSNFSHNFNSSASNNSSRIIPFPVVAQHQIGALNATNATQNATLIHKVVVAQKATALNATQANATVANFTHLQQAIANLTKQFELLKLY